MLVVRHGFVFGTLVLTSVAGAQVTPVLQERSVQTSVTVSSGGSANDSAEATNFGPFNPSITSSITGPAGAGADAQAAQDSGISAAQVFGRLSASGDVRTGTTFITGKSDAQSSLLFIFNLTSASQVEFEASGALEYVGRNPDGEPSDLSGMSRVRLVNAITEELIAGFQLNSDAGSDSASFAGSLPAGQYAILAFAQLHAFSADLIGPPARTGSGDATASFSLTIIPTPGAAVVLAMGGLFAARRRRG